MRWHPASWKRAGASFDDAASQAGLTLDGVTARTTDPNVIGATGISTFDGIVALALGGMNAVMAELATGLRDGLASEGALLSHTGEAFELTEDANTVDSSMIAEW